MLRSQKQTHDPSRRDKLSLAHSMCSRQWPALSSLTRLQFELFVANKSFKRS